jgi:hypothetical protein
MWTADSTCTKEHSIKTWTKERKIYLAAGLLACLVGIVLIAYPR